MIKLPKSKMDQKAIKSVVVKSRQSMQNSIATSTQSSVMNKSKRIDNQLFNDIQAFRCYVPSLAETSSAFKKNNNGKSKKAKEKGTVSEEKPVRSIRIKTPKPHLPKREYLTYKNKISTTTLNDRSYFLGQTSCSKMLPVSNE